MSENIMSYFNVYVEDYKLMKIDLKKSEIFEIFDAISELAFFGENSFISKNKKQEFYYNKFVKNLENSRAKRQNRANKIEQNTEQNTEQNSSTCARSPSTYHLTPNNTFGNKLPQVLINKTESDYFFEKEIIKLNEKDFRDWERAYPELNLTAELLMYDKWLAENVEDSKGWYVRASNFLLKQNEKRKKQHLEQATEPQIEWREEEFYL